MPDSTLPNKQPAMRWSWQAITNSAGTFYEVLCDGAAQLYCYNQRVALYVTLALNTLDHLLTLRGYSPRSNPSNTIN